MKRQIVFRRWLRMSAGVLLCCVFFTDCEAQAIPRDTTYSVNEVYKKIHLDFPQAVPARDSLPAGVESHLDLVYAVLDSTPFGKRQLHLDIFRPSDKQKRPALIMIHGGGWRSGTKEMQVPMAQMLASKGFVTIPVEYQLSLEAQYPAAVYNIKAAIRWVRAHAEAYGIDTSKIAISGCSAGGQLAALVGLTNQNPFFEGNQGNNGFSSAVSAILDIDGIVDFLAPSNLNLKRKPDAADVAWLGGNFESKPAFWKEASPIYWASASGAIPMLFMNSGFSRFHSGQDELIGMLKEWNVYYEVHPFEVKMHPFWLFHPWVERVVDLMEAFLKRQYQTVDKPVRK